MTRTLRCPRAGFSFSFYSSLGVGVGICIMGFTQRYTLRWVAHQSG